MYLIMLRQIHCPMLIVMLLVISTASHSQAQATTQPGVVGHYKATRGDPNKDSFYSVMTLELRSGGSMSSSLTRRDPADPDKTIENKAEGTWIQAGDTIKVTVDTLDGQPVAANNPRKTLTLTVADGGKQLTSDGGPQFTRQ